MANKYVSDSNMPEDLRNDWLKALRSGEYKQTSGYLETAEGNCCLGVLCRVAKVKAKKSQHACTEGTKDFDGDFTELTEKLKKKFGLDDGDCGVLMAKNDGITIAGAHKHSSFKQIANWIEKNIPVKPRRKKTA